MILQIRESEYSYTYTFKNWQLHMYNNLNKIPLVKAYLAAENKLTYYNF